MKTITLLLAAFLFGGFGPNGQEGYEVGDTAIDFSLRDVSGEMISFNSFPNAKGYILIFTCNHCPYSRAYEDRLIALQKKYAPKGYPLIAINPNDPGRVPEDSFEAMQKRAKEKNFNFHYVLDETQEIAATYGAARTPHVFLVNKENGTNILRYIGAIDDSAMSEKDVKKKYLENAVDALLAGQPVDPDYTLAIGCTVKWRK